MVTAEAKPPPRDVVCVTGLVILAIIGIERFIGWPDALTVNKVPRNPARP